MARTAFLGTPEFALPALAALAAATDLRVVVAQPDKARGRGQAVTQSPTVTWALSHGIPVLQPVRASDDGFRAALAALDLDLGVVAAYGKILPRSLLALPRLGFVNVHASLLPRYRGAAPIQWAIARGESLTGVTLMQMDEGLDTGSMLARAIIPIAADDTGGSLSQKLSLLGGELLTRELPALLEGRLAATPQDPAEATLAPKLTRADALLDWRTPAAALHDRVRAFQPWPSAHLQLPSGLLKVLATRAEAESGPPGAVLAAGKQGLVIAASLGALRVLEVQPEGKRRMTASEFLAGHPIAVGTVLQSPA